jgi:hypothetical protein
MQDNQILKAEIIAALDFLPPDSLKLLAKFIAILSADIAEEEIQQFDFIQELKTLPKSARIISPHLANREQIVNFKKEIVEVEVDDSL